jgi:hypothetical protein
MSLSRTESNRAQAALAAARTRSVRDVTKNSFNYRK